MNPKHACSALRQETLNAHGASAKKSPAKWPKVFARVVAPTSVISTTGIAVPPAARPKTRRPRLHRLRHATRTEVRRHLLAFDRETFKFFASQYALDAVRRELLAKNAA